jgi:hypothetical protein
MNCQSQRFGNCCIGRRPIQTWPLCCAKQMDSASQ